MNNYEVWLDDPTGRRVTLIDEFSGLTAVRVANTPGALSITLPSKYDRLIKRDSIIEVWRKPDEGALKLFNAYLITGRNLYDDGDVEKTTLTGPDGVSLLSRRIVAYAAGTTSAEMNTYADDMMKTIVSEACTTAATDTDRDWSALGFTVAANTSAGQSISMAFAYRKVLEVLKDIAEASRNAGTRLYFDVVPIPQSDGTLGWGFRTYTDQPGIDHTTNAQVTFGREWGNLKGPSLTHDYTEEINVVYSLGQGEGSERVVEEVEDVTRSGASPWARSEASYNCSGQASDTAEVYAAGQAQLSENRPRLEFTGTLADTPVARFGIDWGFGDRVVITYRGYQFDAIVTSVVLSVSEKGQETITAGFELI